MGKAKGTGHHAPYFSEKQICDTLWKASDDWWPCESGTLYREQEIGHGLRPDFLSVGPSWTEEGKISICAIEVKRNADVYSVAQVGSYLFTLRRHAKLVEVPDRCVEGWLMAQTFDRGVYSIAEIAGITLVRLRVAKDGGITTEFEDHVFDRAPADPEALEFLRKHVTKLGVTA